GARDVPRHRGRPGGNGTVLHLGMECCGMTTNIVAPARETLISIRDVSVAYGSRRVLDRVSLDIYRGEIVALLGGSGSGKTTLLRRIIGVERRDSGSIVMGGVDLAACSPAELAAVRRKIGVAFQESALF